MEQIYNNKAPHDLKIKNSTLKSRKIKLLQKPTLSQKKAEKIVRNIAFKYFKYHVQSERVFKPYILDIYIKDIKTGIEIDGGIHNKKECYDNRRDEYLLQYYGIKIYRFTNDEVNNNLFYRSIWELCIRGLKEYIDIIHNKMVDKNINNLFKKYIY